MEDDAMKFKNTVEISEEDEPMVEPSQKKAEKAMKPKISVGVKRQRKLTFGVWVNFDFLEPDENGELFCKCKQCGKLYNAESRMGTGNLKRHLKNCTKRTFRDVGQMILDSSASGSLANRVPAFDPDVFRELVIIAVVKHELPFQFAEYEGIRKCFTYLHPHVKVVSRYTIKADILKMFKREKQKVKETLSSVSGRIALTSDCWSSITTDGYLSLTAHFIDDSWCLQKMILNFSYMPPPHTGLALCNHVCKLLKEWGIQKKVFSITLDNAASNDSMADLMKTEMDLVCEGAYFHVRCCAHIMNLIVQDGLKEVDEAILKVRESVKYCKGSQSRKHKFLSSVAHVELESSKGLRQDVPTRWNSTYLMLESVLYYKRAFIHLQRTDANYVHCPTSEEWARTERIFRFLRVFYEVTCAFSGTKYPTANLYFPNVLKVRILLEQEKESQDKFMSKMAGKMFVKFEKYWDEFSTVMAIAAILDPRYKLQIVEWGYEKVHGVGYSMHLSSIKDKLVRLFDEYMVEPSLKKATENQSKFNEGIDSEFDTTSDAIMMVSISCNSSLLNSNIHKILTTCFF